MNNILFDLPNSSQPHSAIPSVASKHVHVRKKNWGANRTCFAPKHVKFGVGGCCRLDLFSLNKISFAIIFRC